MSRNSVISTLPKPFESGSKFYRDEEDQAVRAKYRTECWLEQCMFDERLCSPDEQVTFLPLVVQTPVPGKFPFSKRSIEVLGIDIDEGAESVVLAISGFSQSEKYGLKRLFRALGKTLSFRDK
jgi:DNA replication regulator DPB11